MVTLLEGDGGNDQMPDGLWACLWLPMKNDHEIAYTPQTKVKYLPNFNH